MNKIDELSKIPQPINTYLVKSIVCKECFKGRRLWRPLSKKCGTAYNSQFPKSEKKMNVVTRLRETADVI